MGLGLRGLVLGVVGAVVGTILGCSSFVDSHFQTSYQTGLLKAEQLEREGFPAEALAIYERTLPRIPARSRQERAVALMRTGDCQVGLGKINEAFVNFQKAADVDPENLEDRLHLAEFYVAAGAPNPA